MEFFARITEVAHSHETAPSRESIELKVQLFNNSHELDTKEYLVKITGENRAELCEKVGLALDEDNEYDEAELLEKICRIEIEGETIKFLNLVTEISN